MTFKISLIKRKQSIKISILKKLGVCFVAFLIPASALAGLIVIRPAYLLNKKKKKAQMTTYSVIVPEKRALSTLV